MADFDLMLYKSYLNSFLKKLLEQRTSRTNAWNLQGAWRCCSAGRHPLVTDVTDLGMTLSLLFLFLEQLKL